jgi:hypothetical protein
MTVPTTRAAGSPARSAATAAAAIWMRFWFEPADARPLAVVRILTATLGLLLLWSYAGDLETWFGPGGMIPVETAAAARPAAGVSLFDAARSSGAVRGAFAATVGVFVLLLLGVATPVTSLVAAVVWAGLLHRGPMLAGAADDCLAVLLWCLAIGPAGAHFSLDRLVGGLRGRAAPAPSWRAQTAEGLIHVHAAAIAAAGLLAQLRGDGWWDGSAAWWLAARPESRLVDVTGLLARSEYLTNLVTHAVTVFEAVFAIGLWIAFAQVPLARAGLVAWPLVGLLAGEPLWGCAMAIFCVPLALRPLTARRAVP